MADRDDPLEALRDRLAAADRAHAERYPGEPPGRQPVHTVYGGAHLFRRDVAARMGRAAAASLAEHAPDAASLAGAIELPDDPPDLGAEVHRRVTAKLGSEPVEDFRIDFEDGFGIRSDEEEDQAAEAAGREAAAGLEEGTLPPFVGIRVKPFAGDLAARAARTIERFLDALVGGSGGGVPEPFHVTIPKVTDPVQVAALAELLDRHERRLGLSPGALAIEIMVETPQSLVAADGSLGLTRLVDAGGGRCAAAHFGVYDYTASLQIGARDQHLDHPACDFARHLVQVALAGRGVWLCDGATNVLPAGDDRASVHRAWRLHYRHVRHSLRHAWWQGWDLHPAQLPTRYAAVYAHYLEALDEATARLANFVAVAARATRTGDVFDDAATGLALLDFFRRGLRCGAITADEAGRTGLTEAEIMSGTFASIVAARGAAG